MRYKNILFDLDGTLIDSAPGIQVSFNKAYRSIYKLECPTSIKHLIGPPINQVLRTVTSEISPDIEYAFVEEFKKHYDLEGYKFSTLYPCILDVLKDLFSQGFNLFIATNKRNFPTNLILTHLGINPFFKGVYCSDSFQIAFANKTELVRSLIGSFSLKNTETLFVGDTKHDGLAAEQNNLNFALVQYGYGDFPNPTYKIDNINNLVNIL